MDSANQRTTPSCTTQILMTMLPNIMSMQPPSTREEFEERINLVREQLYTGKMHPQGMEGMFNIRLLPNGRIDMLSIDESSRLSANMAHQMHTTDMGKMLRGLESESEA